MFDNLSDRLGGVFDKLKGRKQAFPAKVGTGFAVRKRAEKTPQSMRNRAHV